MMKKKRERGRNNQIGCGEHLEKKREIGKRSEFRGMDEMRDD